MLFLSLGKNFPEKLSFILEFSFGYTTVARKICFFNLSF